MKAIRYHEFGPPEVLKLEEIEAPVPKSNEILVQIHAAAINPKDILMRKGKFQKMDRLKFPRQAGFDLAGTVLESGNSTQFKKGDRIFGMINGWKGTAYAEISAVKEEECFKIPENLSFEEAAAIPLVGQTSLQALRNLGKAGPGKTICINGASGGVGSIGIQIAKTLGAEVISISSERNLELCSSLGADHTWDYKTKNVLEERNAFDIFYDVFGNYNFRKAKPTLKKGGLYITTVPSLTIVLDQLKTSFSNRKAKLVVVKSTQKDLKWLVQHIESGEIKPVVDQVLPLAEAAQGHAYIETKRAKGKVILKII
jgi:NADPH:quinone reductase-like Zn-dependent oxidoreductase